MATKSRRQIGLALGFALFFAALWYFWYTPVVYPLKIFVVLLHELSHAVALWVTGGTVESISLDPRQGGVTLGRGGIAFITLSAGYLGSLAFGALLVLGAQSAKIRSGALLATVGASVLVLTALYIRGGRLGEPPYHGAGPHLGGLRHPRHQERYHRPAGPPLRRGDAPGTDRRPDLGVGHPLDRNRDLGGLSALPTPAPPRLIRPVWEATFRRSSSRR